jgi:hypothetical protein
MLKGLLALMFVFSAVNKLLLPKAKLLEKGMKALKNLNEMQIKTTGMLELAGALGLVLPYMLGWPFLLSVLAAIGLALTMLVAGLLHYRLKLSVLPNVLIFLMCVAVVYLEYV